MKKVALSEVKDDLSKFLRVAEKEEVVITRHGKPLARLSTVSTSADLGAPTGGDELVERFRRLREQISRECPDTDSLTWEQLKAMARE